MNKCPPRPVQRHELCSEQEAAAEAAGVSLLLHPLGWWNNTNHRLPSLCEICHTLMTLDAEAASKPDFGSSRNSRYSMSTKRRRRSPPEIPPASCPVMTGVSTRVRLAIGCRQGVRIWKLGRVASCVFSRIGVVTWTPSVARLTRRGWWLAPQWRFSASACGEYWRPLHSAEAGRVGQENGQRGVLCFFSY